MVRPPQGRVRGFTMIEAIVVIAISGIIAVVLSNLISRPIEGAVQAGARAILVDEADHALRMMARQIRSAVPNTLRSNDSSRLEMVETVDAASYRARAGVDDPGGANYQHVTPDSLLQFNKPDDQFNVLGVLTTGFAAQCDLTHPGERLVVYNTQAAVFYQDATSGSNPGVITPCGTTITATNPDDETHITLGSAFQFRQSSPEQRLYVAGSPISFICGAGELRMYRDYPIQSGQPTAADLTTLGASSGLLARDVQSCSFTYQTPTATRTALVTLTLTLHSADGGTVRLIHQVHVENTP